jgi:hypothetical protein
MLSTVAAPGISQAPTVSLTAYADDVTVILQLQEDVKVLSQVLQTNPRAASAKINWEKCSSFLIGDRIRYHSIATTLCLEFGWF